MQTQKEKEMGAMLKPIFREIDNAHSAAKRTLTQFVNTYGDVQFYDDCIVYGSKKFVKLYSKHGRICVCYIDIDNESADLQEEYLDYITSTDMLEDMTLALRLYMRHNVYTK